MFANLKSDAADLEKRQEQILAIHRQEQAEAKAAEAAAPAPNVIEHHECPHCPRSFKSPAWLTNHVRKAHGQGVQS